MAELVWSAEAQNWLREIFDYIAAENPAAATAALEAIRAKAELLSKFPELGYRYEASEGADIRVLLYRHYRIVYRIESSARIEVLGVFHSAMDMDRYLR